jgi:hypothetical protein
MKIHLLAIMQQDDYHWQCSLDEVVHRNDNQITE